MAIQAIAKTTVGRRGMSMAINYDKLNKQQLLKAIIKHFVVTGFLLPADNRLANKQVQYTAFLIDDMV